MANIFFLKHDVGYKTLKRSLENKINVDLVTINQKNKNEKWFKKIISICRTNNIPFHITRNINKDKIFFDKLRNYNNILGVSIYYTEIFKKNLIGYFKLGIINFHQSLLPKYRGLMPVQWAITSGETYTGITAHFINEKIDMGKIILQEKIKISSIDTGLIISNKLKKITPKLFLKVFKLIKSKHFKKKKLIKIEKSPYFKKRNSKIDQIDIDANLNEINNKIRGLSFKKPYAWLYIKKKKIFVGKSNFTNNNESHVPGLNIVGNKVFIRKKNKTLELKKFYTINNQKKIIIKINEK